MMRTFLLLIFGTLLLQSCASLRDSPKYQLSEGYYYFRQDDSGYEKVYIRSVDDTVNIYSLEGAPIRSIKAGADQFFQTRSFDVDVISILFKYRPGVKGIPRQINTNFNGNVYFGYRVDKFKVDFEKTPAGQNKITRHRALTVGVFGGLGSTAVNPTTTSNGISTEYDGLVFSRGLAAMVGLKSLTVGLGIGWDYLSGNDRESWVYQNKPWFGLTLGLNVN